AVRGVFRDLFLSASDRPSGEEPARHTTQIAAHYGGLNCFRRLLPRGSEGGVDKTPQINIPVGYRLLILNYIMHKRSLLQYIFVKAPGRSDFRTRKDYIL